MTVSEKKRISFRIKHMWSFAVDQNFLEGSRRFNLCWKLPPVIRNVEFEHKQCLDGMMMNLYSHVIQASEGCD